ncbi:ABC transporter ATP-binding protein [Longispora albida]|uniref:ABC transporter ATP-binding protein n=1 Tax=Longispora albida TaxID=203523 RepID=UPI000374220E|nr:ABC transporter ATP-binding protein [Longispora albida]
MSPALNRPIPAALRTGWQATGPRGLAILAAGAAVSGLPVLTAWAGKLLIDGLTGKGVPGVDLWLLAVAAALLGGAVAGAGFLISYLAAWMRTRISLHVEERLYRTASQYRGLRVLEDPDFQDRFRLAEESAQHAPGALASFVLTAVRAVLGSAGFVVLVLSVWPPMGALLVLAAVPAVVAQLGLARRFARTAEETMTARRSLHMYKALQSELAGAAEHRLFGLGPLFHARMTRASVAVNGADLRVQGRVALTQGALALLSAVTLAAGSAVVVTRAAGGELTAGDVVLFLSAVAGLQAAVAGVGVQLTETAQALRLFQHYLAIVDAGPDLPDGEGTPGQLRRGIEFRDVWFRYDEDGQWVLRGLDLSIPAGQATGLAGVNGAGKSTIIGLLCRLYDPQRGQILWDGEDIRTYSISELRRRIGVTFQDFMTYDLTVAENIGVGDLSLMDDHGRVERAAELAGAAPMIGRLPHGYRTLLSRIFFGEGGETRGVALSGGQRQRVALARSLMRDDAELLILDEPSSGLDAVSEYEIHETLRRHRAGRTSLLVSHRLSALREADRIVVVEAGRITEQGSHSALVAAGGRYAELFALQASGYVEVS